ncbi:MAG: hypothetical protein M1818_001290 [Claussenomyces sp. TS43310]|nr:MAG: hypothetical protein M1818_001290 [Claussenomyces sp. TS43310]
MLPSTVADSSIVERHEASNDGSMTLDTALVISEAECANLGGEILDWDDPEIDFANFLNPQTNDETVQYPSSGSSSLVRHSTPSTNQTFQVHQAVSSPNVSIPTLPTHTLRSLIQRPKVNAGAQRIANLMLHTLKSYPLMMLRHNTLPPFIHPCLISANVEGNNMEPLSNCISLVHLISSGVQGSRKLFWKNVRQECERLCEDHPKSNKWELLAAMQALSIYILIRLDEGETDYNDVDSLLLATVAATTKQINRSDIAPCSYGLDISWKDWIFRESRQRLSVVYRVLNMLVYFEPAAMCDMQRDLILAPLPAKKQLWEAGDEFIWKAESEREPRFQTAYGLAANGELVKVDKGQLYCGDSVLLYKSADTRTPSSSPANWEEWCSGMDGFGGLIMLAASLTV